MTHEENDQFFISPEESGQRLDKILAQRFAAVQSRSYFQMLIEEERVLLNGLPVKKRIKPEAGDEVEVHFILSPEIGLTPENIPLEILYEDSDIIAVNKPSGMVVHPATGNWTGTFVNALLWHCKQIEALPGGSALRPGIVHRLDKDTSGVMLAAKTATAHQRLIELFSSRKIYKEYLVVCIGNPGTTKIEAPIGRHPVHRKLMCVLPEGKPAVSYVSTLACDGKISLVKVILETGRTHQVRVHLKHQGTPVLGDMVYGNTQANTKYGTGRQLLHAKTMRLSHPITGQPLELTAPLPQDFQRWQQKLG